MRRLLQIYDRSINLKFLLLCQICELYQIFKVSKKDAVSN